MIVKVASLILISVLTTVQLKIKSKNKQDLTGHFRNIYEPVCQLKGS